ncbi:MAG: hypothetical protein J6Z01_17040 [Bacteroidales bacterium]|nr:hypothetical protein [Bacteroidales bacterium]
MSELQEKIEKILSKRKTGLEECKKQLSVLNHLTDSFTELKDKLSENVYPEFEDSKNLYFSKINEIENSIMKVKEKTTYLQKRFERQTVNLGVAGVTHAGKSTLLQAISGLTDSEIPKADKDSENYGNPTTAAHSEIYNSPKKEAIVFFRTTSEFIAHINEYLEQLGKRVNTLSQFENLDLSEIESNLSSDAKSKYNFDRIKGIKEAFNSFKDCLNSSSITITDFSQLRKYVAYSNDSITDRIYPAVKLVKIYCPFNVEPANIKLGLIDLPGFGENPSVDKQMVEGLENDVDNVILIYRPTQTKSGIQWEERESFDKINGVQAGINKRENFLNILVNVDEDLGSLKDNSVNLTIKQIDEVICQNGKYKYRSEKVNALNSAAVKDYVTKVVNNMANTLSEIDGDIIEYNKIALIKPVMDSVNSLISELKKFTAQKGGDKIAESHEDRKKAVKLRKEIAVYLTKKVKDYEALNENAEKPILEVINQINRDNKQFIDQNLFRRNFKNYDELKEYYKGEIAAQEDVNKLNQPELSRIWNELLVSYNQLDNYYQTELEKMKMDILTVFKTNTGDFIPSLEEKSETIINNILSKIVAKGEQYKDEVLYQVFSYLKQIQYSFKQNLYPYLVKNKIGWDMLASKSVEARKTVADENELADKLNTLSKQTNAEMSSALKEFDCFSAYLLCVYQQFKLFLTNKSEDEEDNEDVATESYWTFVQLFKDEIFPEEYAEIKKYLELDELLNNISKITF